MIVDLQVNVETPDGDLTDPAMLAEAARSAGLDGVVLTQDGNLAPDWSRYREAGVGVDVQVFEGVKITSNHGLLLCILPEQGGALVADFADQADDLYDAGAVIDAIEELGGITVALRPYDRDVTHPMGDHLFSLQGLNACEVQNPSLSEIANDLALEAASSMDMPYVGTSGSNGSTGLGSAATLLRTAITSQAELVEAIRSGECWPVTISDRVPVPEPADRGRGPKRRPPPRREGAGARDPHNKKRRRRRGGRGRGPGPGSGRPDDIGNRAPRRSSMMEEDIGNRIRPEEQNPMAEDIGNRLAPGESSPFHEAIKKVDDDVGNR